MNHLQHHGALNHTKEKCPVCAFMLWCPSYLFIPNVYPVLNSSLFFYPIWYIRDVSPVTRLGSDSQFGDDLPFTKETNATSESVAQVVPEVASNRIRACSVHSRSSLPAGSVQRQRHHGCWWRVQEDERQCQRLIPRHADAQREHAAEEGDLAAQWSQSDRRKHDRLWHLCLPKGCAHLQRLLWPVTRHLGHWRSVLRGGGPLLRWTWHNYHQIRGILCIHPGVIWWLYCIYPSVDISVDHWAHQPGGHCHYICKLPGAATLSHMWTTICSSQAHRCSLFM